MLLLGLQTTPENIDMQGDWNKKKNKWTMQAHWNFTKKKKNLPTTILRNELEDIYYTFIFLR